MASSGSTAIPTKIRLCQCVQPKKAFLSWCTWTRHTATHELYGNERAIEQTHKFVSRLSKRRLGLSFFLDIDVQDCDRVHTEEMLD